MKPFGDFQEDTRELFRKSMQESVEKLKAEFKDNPKPKRVELDAALFLAVVDLIDVRIQEYHDWLSVQLGE